MEVMNRREVLLTAAAAAIAGALPRTRLLADAPPAQTIIDVGPKSDYGKDGITPTWSKTNKIIIIRNAGEIYASSSICTHKGCIVRPNPTNDGFTCPCHHATYDITGAVTHRPAKIALERYAISVDANDHIIVDKSKPFPQDQWTDPASFISVPEPQTQPSAG